VPETNPLGALGGRGQEDLGRRGVGVLLEEVVLDFPRVVDAEPVGQLDLAEGVLEELELAAFRPRARKLMLVEDAEAHCPSPFACGGPAVGHYHNAHPVSTIERASLGPRPIPPCPAFLRSTAAATVRQCLHD